MEAKAIQEVHEFIGFISPNEIARNRELKRKIAFLKKYLKSWDKGRPIKQTVRSNPNQFYLRKEKDND